MSAGWQRIFGVVGVGYAVLTLGFDFSVLTTFPNDELDRTGLGNLLGLEGPLAMLFIAYVVGEVVFGFGRMILQTNIYAIANGRNFETILVLSDDPDVGPETIVAIRQSLVLLELFSAITVVAVLWLPSLISEMVETSTVNPIFRAFMLGTMSMLFARINQGRADAFLLLSEAKRLKRLSLGIENKLDTDVNDQS